MGLNRLMSEGEKDMPPGAELVSDAGAESPVHSPFISLIRREVASPPVGTKMHRALASRGSLHKWGPKTKPVRICWFQPWGVWAGGEGHNSPLKWLKATELRGGSCSFLVRSSQSTLACLLTGDLSFSSHWRLMEMCNYVLGPHRIGRWIREKLSSYSS